MRQVMLRLGLVVTMTACALPEIRLHTYADYLNEAVGHANHDAIAKKMGAPHRTMALEKGGDLWTYEFCRPGTVDYLKTASPTGTVSTPHGYCQNLNLVFNNSGKLAEWRDSAAQRQGLPAIGAYSPP